MQPQYHRSSEGSGLVSSTLGRWTDPSISSTLSSDPVILKTLKGIRLCAQGGKAGEFGMSISCDCGFPGSRRLCPVSSKSRRHVATLLLGASGRRVHDLTLMHVTEDGLQRIPPDRVFLAFDSKTDSNSRSQSGWRLSPNTSELDRSTFSPVHFNKRLCETSIKGYNC
uniref:Uncharacterized protein n=1 Tax=Cacopsylla melanoneura TaxID=428564 RepID=A0A8D8XHQ0_9HEMI